MESTSLKSVFNKYTQSYPMFSNVSKRKSGKSRFPENFTNNNRSLSKQMRWLGH